MKSTVKAALAEHQKPRMKPDLCQQAWLLFITIVCRLFVALLMSVLNDACLLFAAAVRPGGWV